MGECEKEREKERKRDFCFLTTPGWKKLVGEWFTEAQHFLAEAQNSILKEKTCILLFQDLAISSELYGYHHLAVYLCTLTLKSQ